MHYYLFREGQTEGPYTAKSINELHSRGLVAGETLAFRADQPRQWKPLGKLFRHIKPTAPKIIKAQAKVPADELSWFANFRKLALAFFAGFVAACLVLISTGSVKPPGSLEPVQRQLVDNSQK